MWYSSRTRPRYRIAEVELASPLPTLPLGEFQGAHVMLRYRDRPVGRVWLDRGTQGPEVSSVKLREAVGAHLHHAYACAILDGMSIDHNTTPVSLTVAVCTRDHPLLLRRALRSICDVLSTPTGADVDILVVDNAPSDDAVRMVAGEFDRVRYVEERSPGLNFARNCALAETDKQWIAFIDDDAVMDRSWLSSLRSALAASPNAGCLTGPIMPFLLNTRAQLRFERADGFGKGFRWNRFARERFDDPVHPAAAGKFGTGACMAFSTGLLRELGGFDEALDTGPKLPGGGDTDMFYRTVRSGRPLIYVPGLVVHHEHRDTLKKLRRQYYSWGLATMALASKCRSTDPEIAARHRVLALWYLRDKAIGLAKSCLGRGPLPPHFVLAEIAGALVGLFGEYRRSQARVSKQRKAAAS